MEGLSSLDQAPGVWQRLRAAAEFINAAVVEALVRTEGFPAIPAADGRQAYNETQVVMSAHQTSADIETYLQKF